MQSIKVISLFIRDVLGISKRNWKQRLLRAQWKAANPHNHTIANTIFPMDKVTVGRETYGHLNIHSYGHKGECLKIGNCCSIAGNVHFILSGSHDYERFTTFPFEAYYPCVGADSVAKGPIIVEDDVWIGYGATILAGVRIGKGAVIAAGSIVAKDVPSYAIWIGNGVKKYRFSEEVCQKLQDIEYASLSGREVTKKNLLCVHINEENVDAVMETLMQCKRS